MTLIYFWLQGGFKFLEGGGGSGYCGGLCSNGGGRCVSPAPDFSPFAEDNDDACPIRPETGPYRP